VRNENCLSSLVLTQEARSKRDLRQRNEPLARSNFPFENKIKLLLPFKLNGALLMAPTVETAAAISQDCDEYASQHKKLKRGIRLQLPERLGLLKAQK
jgi:hypothetical protein